MRSPILTRLTLLAGFLASIVCAWGSDLQLSPEGEAPDHRTVKCSGCHLPSARQESSGNMPQCESLCRECHRGPLLGAQDPPLVFHTNPSRSCLECHLFHVSRGFTVAGDTFAIDGADSEILNHCVSCHSPEGRLDALSKGHREAARFYHTSSQTLARLTPSEGCLVCHSQNPPPNDVELPASMRPPRFVESASHTFGVPVPLGRTISALSIRWELDPRIRLFGDQIECQTCHQVAGDAQRLLVAFDNPSELCLGCHERRTSGLRLAER